MLNRKNVLLGVREGAVPQKKVRKKSQAFGVPKSAATKAIIKRNATESSLLRLPLEVRHRIWRLVLGDQLLHIAVLEPYFLKSPSDSDKVELMTTCCRSPYTDTEIFKRSKRTVWELIGDSVEYIDATSVEQRHRWVQDHIDCRPHLGCLDEVIKPWDVPSTGAVFLPVQILRVCRQVYTEANLIMWSTNMFSFKCTKAFGTFLRARSTAQKATISKLRIDLYLSNRPELQEDFMGFYRECYIRTLRNVRNLSVNVDFDTTHRGQSEHYRSRAFIEELLRRELSNVLRYKIFPLHTVNVVIRNETRMEYEGDRLRLEDRIEIAEAMRQILLDPEGAQEYEEWKACTKAEDAELQAGLGSNAFLQLISSAMRTLDRIGNR